MPAATAKRKTAPKRAAPKPAAKPAPTPKPAPAPAIRFISVNAAAEMAQTTVPTVRKWIDRDIINAENVVRSAVGLRRGPITVIAVRYAEFAAFLLSRGIPVNPEHKPPSYPSPNHAAK